MRDLDGRWMDVDLFDASVQRHHRSSARDSHAHECLRAAAVERQLAALDAHFVSQLTGAEQFHPALR
jgi:hypothetical protein